MIITTTNPQEIRNQIQKSKKANPSEEIIVRAGDEEFNNTTFLKAADILLEADQR